MISKAFHCSPKTATSPKSTSASKACCMPHSPPIGDTIPVLAVISTLLGMTWLSFHMTLRHLARCSCPFSTPCSAIICVSPYFLLRNTCKSCCPPNSCRTAFFCVHAPLTIAGSNVALATECSEWHDPHQVSTSVSSSFEPCGQQCSGEVTSIPEVFVESIPFVRFFLLATTACTSVRLRIQRLPHRKGNDEVTATTYSRDPKVIQTNSRGAQFGFGVRKYSTDINFGIVRMLGRFKFVPVFVFDFFWLCDDSRFAPLDAAFSATFA